MIGCSFIVDCVMCTLETKIFSILLSGFVGGKKFCTTVDTLTQREPHSMLAAMFSGRHTVCKDSDKVYMGRQNVN